MYSFYAVVLLSMASLSSSWGAVLPYSSSAMVKSERNGDNFAYSITQDQQSFAPIARALPLNAHMPVMGAGSPGYPLHGGGALLPGGQTLNYAGGQTLNYAGGQTLNYAAHPSMLVPHHPVPAPALAAYNPHLLFPQPQAHIPHGQYLH